MRRGDGEVDMKEEGRERERGGKGEKNLSTKQHNYKAQEHADSYSEYMCTQTRNA